MSVNAEPVCDDGLLASAQIRFQTARKADEPSHPCFFLKATAYAVACLGDTYSSNRPCLRPFCSECQALGFANVFR